MADLLTMLGPFAAGVSLAAVAGLRAFLPLFAIGLAARADWLPLGGGFDWLASTPSMVGFGTAVVLEILADKVPVIDNFLDAVAVLVKPVAGIAASAAVLTDIDPFWRATIAIGVGGSVAGTVHLAKAKVRLGSSVATLGTGNPVLSLAEDLAAVLGTLLALLMPVLALVMAAVLAWFMVRAGRKVWSGARSPRQGSQVPASLQ